MAERRPPEDIWAKVERVAAEQQRRDRQALLDYFELMGSWVGVIANLQDGIRREEEKG